MTESGFTIEQIQEAFRKAGAHIPSARMAQKIIDALPAGVIAVGWTSAEVLDVIITNRQNGAVERLLKLKQDMDRKREATQRALDGKPTSGDRRRNGKHRHVSVTRQGT